MICDRCQGIGYAPMPTVVGSNGHPLGLPSFEPCPDCQGTGIGYCCDEAGANPPNTHADARKVQWVDERVIDWEGPFIEMLKARKDEGS